MTTATADADTTTADTTTTTQQTTADTTQAATQAATTQAATTALAKPVPLHERFPEKFRVMKGENEFDAEASTAKVLEGYKALEERMKAAGAPPKSAEEYAINVPDELKDTLKDFKLSPEFLKAAHEKGITQGQLDFMLSNYFKEAPELMKGALNNSVEATIQNLDKAWGADYEKNLDAASKAFAAYADEADKGRFDDIMRDPALAYRILAKIGPELGEAGGVPRDAQGASEESIQGLLTSDALANPKHPDHKAARAKVDAYYAKKYGTNPVN